MSKFNKKSVGVQPTEINEMGEKAFKLDAREDLVSTVMTTFLQDSYYANESEIAERILKDVDKVDPLFVAKLAIYARTEGNMRSVSHLLAAYISKYIAGKEYSKRFYERIVVRPDDMSEILSCYAGLNDMDLSNKSLRKIPNSIKKGFKAALERLDAYQIDKYKMNSRQVKLVDLVNLLHPTPTQKNAEAYRRLINGESLDGLYESKILEKEMSKTGQVAKTEEEKREAKAEAISAVLDNVKGMPIFNLLRNLRNIVLYAPNRVDDAVAQLTIRDKVLNSRLLPFRFATAYEQIWDMKYDECVPSVKTSIAFESDLGSIKVTREEFENAKKKLLDAIETALEYSCENIPELEGNTAVLVDDSGSMRSMDSYAPSRVSAFSDVNTSMIGHLFASMFAWKQKDVYIGLFGDKLIPVKVDRSMRMLDFNKYSYDEGAKCGPSTEAGIYEFFRLCIAEKKKIDNVIVFSDCQIGEGASTVWYGYSPGERSEGFQQLFKEFKKINPNCNFIVCNLRNDKGNTVFHPSQRILNIAGWSDKIFDVITSHTVGFKKMIEEIEKIEI